MAKKASSPAVCFQVTYRKIIDLCLQFISWLTLRGHYDIDDKPEENDFLSVLRPHYQHWHMWCGLFAVQLYLIVCN
jgi:hypothetical protein